MTESFRRWRPRHDINRLRGSLQRKPADDQVAARAKQHNAELATGDPESILVQTES